MLKDLDLYAATIVNISSNELFILLFYNGEGTLGAY
jgi:hypothetical protein